MQPNTQVPLPISLPVWVQVRYLYSKLKTIRGSSLQPSCARQHSPWIPSCSKAVSALQLASACGAACSCHLTHGPAKRPEPHGHKKAEYKMQSEPLLLWLSEGKDSYFSKWYGLCFPLKYSSQQAKGSTKWHKVKKRSGSFPGDLRCSQPNRVIQVSKSRRRGDLPNLGNLHDSDFVPQMTALPPGSHRLEYRSDQNAQSDSNAWPAVPTHRWTLLSRLMIQESPGYQQWKAAESSELMTWIFKISQVLSQKEDTAATKHIQGPILKIFHSPKPGVPTLWQEVGQEHTKRPKENRIHLCPLGCPACDRKSIHKNMELGHMAECGDTLQCGLFWQESDWMVKGSLGKTNGLEAAMNNEGTRYGEKFTSLVWAPEAPVQKSAWPTPTPLFIKCHISSCPLQSPSLYLSNH